jgi:hypothetical protein
MSRFLRKLRNSMLTPSGSTSTMSAALRNMIRTAAMSAPNPAQTPTAIASGIGRSPTGRPSPSCSTTT